MSKQDYIKIAAAIRKQVEESVRLGGVEGAFVRLALNDLANDLCEVALRENPRFDMTKFKDACGLMRPLVS